MHTIANLASEFHRLYSKEALFETCERLAPRFWTDIEKADDEYPGGGGRFFRILGAISHAYGNPAEGGDWSTSRTRLQVEGSVTGAQIDYTIEMSSKFLEGSKHGGSYSGDGEHDLIVEASKGLYSYLQRLLVAGHGTGRMAVVEANTVAVDTFVCAVPECAWQLRQRQPIDFVDLDTGGTVQASAIIDSIDHQTRTVTLDTAVTLTAGWGVYQADAYGNAMPNGNRNIIDDGDFGATIFGVARAHPNTFLNATVRDNAGVLQDYSEEIVSDTFSFIAGNQDKIPTRLMSNMGIMGEHLRVTTADRLFLQTGKVPDYSIGANHEQIGFTYGGVKVPWVVDRDMPARELYFLYMPGYKKHVLREADWEKVGGSILQLKVAAGGDNYAHAYTANMMIDLNISHRNLNAQGKLSWIRDRMAAGD